MGDDESVMAVQNVGKEDLAGRSSMSLAGADDDEVLSRDPSGHVTQ